MSLSGEDLRFTISAAGYDEEQLYTCVTLQISCIFIWSFIFNLTFKKFQTKELNYYYVISHISHYGYSAVVSVRFSM